MAAARAYLAGGRIGDDLDRLSTLRQHIARLFAGAGAERVDPETLQPADILLDLYGEDIRARAYVVQDPVEGELMLRPDFTVPVARVHMEEGSDPARYAYDGLVWRRQAPGSTRPTEYLQAGIELIGGDDRAADEAEVFTLIQSALGDIPATPVTGDLGIVFAAIDALKTTEARRAALRRHVWRPARFMALLERFTSPPAPSKTRAALLMGDRDTRRSAMEAAGKFVGARQESDVLSRLAVLAEDAATSPLATEEKALMERVLAVQGPMDTALSTLKALNLAPMEEVLARMENRMEALSRRGVDTSVLPFDASFGRRLEYYDGFVFEFRASQPGLPPLGGGGRYDALTATLGQGQGAPAVGGIIRPEAVLAAGGTP